MIKRHCGSYLFALCLTLDFTYFYDCDTGETNIVLIALPWMHRTVLLCYLCFICVYICDFYSDGRQELFACNNAAVSGGKLRQPLFDAIKDNVIVFRIAY